MTDAQRELESLLNTALGDLRAGRPAHGVVAGLSTAFAASSFDDPDADDHAWRERRGAGGPRPTDN